jgi:hypothetical protein
LKVLSELKTQLESSLKLYVGKTTVVSAVDVGVTKSTESPGKSSDVNGVNILFMISMDDGLIESE